MRREQAIAARKVGRAGRIPREEALRLTGLSEVMEAPVSPLAEQGLTRGEER
ncbi:hypothetical protein [Thermus sp.]|uniref:hypothetical protein n=1 Tax=Thermus sp. TaxID=275 RepID=UPI0025F1D049|nr:hypothetical protein [Thermus sp.]MCS6867130.1 hypothetical protein [Thermus sp.]